MFEVIVNDPNAWLEQAKKHLYVVKIIANHFKPIVLKSQTETGIRIAKLACIESISLHLAFALENALKALIIASQPGLVIVKKGRIDSKVFGGGKSGHNLLALSQSAHLDINKQQQDLFKRLTFRAEWAGRYPSPMTETAYVDSSGKIVFYWTADIDLVESTLKQIADNVHLLSKSR